MSSSRNSDELDETALVRAVQNSDVTAFEPPVDAHLNHLRAFIALNCPWHIC